MKVEPLYVYIYTVCTAFSLLLKEELNSLLAWFLHVCTCAVVSIECKTVRCTYQRISSVLFLCNIEILWNNLHTYMYM